MVLVFFLPMAALGTLLHEAAHILVARALGYETQLYYSGMSWERPQSRPRCFERATELLCGAPFRATPQEFEERHAGARFHEFLIILGGPVQSMSMGSLGLLWLWRIRRSRIAGVATCDARLILATALSQFWLRPWALLLAGAIGLGGAPDEIAISSYIGWPSHWGLWGSGLVGAACCCAAIAMLPSNWRLRVLIAGPIGCLIGFSLWYFVIGPLLLPLP